MKWRVLVLSFLSTTLLYAQPDRKQELAARITDDVLSMWSEDDIPGKYSFLVWPAYKELSKESNWPRLEFLRDISTIGDLVEVWPSRQELLQAVYLNLPPGVLKEYTDMTSEQEENRPLCAARDRAAKGPR